MKNFDIKRSAATFAAAALVLCTAMPLLAQGPENGGRGEGRNAPRNEASQRPPRPGGEGHSKEGRLLREVVRMRMEMRRLQKTEERLAEARERLAKNDPADAEPTPFTQREIDLRTELLAIEKARFVSAAQRKASDFLTRINEAEGVRVEGEDKPPTNERLAERLTELKTFLAAVSEENLTFEGLVQLFDEIEPPRDLDAQDGQLQRRLSRLEREAETLHDRLRAIEEEMMMIRGEEFGPTERARKLRGAFPPPMDDDFDEPGRFDGRRMPPNHPSNRPPGVPRGGSMEDAPDGPPPMEHGE